MSDEKRMTPQLIDIARRLVALELDLDYSTEEKLTLGHWKDGKPIYKKTIDCGAMPNNTHKLVPHGITNLDIMVDFKCTTKNPSTKAQAVIPNGATLVNPGVTIDDENVLLRPTYDMTAYTETYVTIWYTKTK